MQRIHDHYKNKGLRVDGMLTREVRKGDERIGFKITDLSSGAEGWLARMGNSVGPRIGKYSVDSEDLEEIGVGALKRAAEGSADLVLVDDIGPMEMTRDASARSPWNWTYFSISKKVNAGDVRRALVEIAKHMRGVGE